MEDHHCPAHTTFTAACKSCVRARAAFLPYPTAPTPHASRPHNNRSFGFTDQMSEAEIHALAHPIRDELRREAIRSMEYEAVDEIVNAIFSEDS